MSKDEILKSIARHTCELLPELEEHHFQRDDVLADLGANSIDRADIINSMMEELELDIPRVEVFGTNNLGELVDLLHEKSRAH